MIFIMDQQPRPFSDFAKDTVRDTIIPTFATLTDTYVFQKSWVTTATIVITYTDSTKGVLQGVTKT